MIAGQRLKAVIVRAARPYWTYKPTSGEGAARHGGRFNPVGVPALYLSFSFNTAAKEVRFSLNADPYTFYFVEVDCEDVYDLTDRTMRNRLGVRLGDLAAPNWESEMHKGIVPASHALAASMTASGAAGIIAPSFSPGADDNDKNLVLWKWVDLTGSSKRSPHSVRVLKRDDLPVSTASWPRKP